jgi:integrase
MSRVVMERSAKWVAAQSKVGLHAVGGVPGLCLQVFGPDSRAWVLRATMPSGRRRRMGLGPYPLVSLADAREAARKARITMLAGTDPIDARKQAVSALRASSAMQVSFKDACERYIERRGEQWRNDRSATAWRSSLEMHAYPVVGKLAVADVERAHIVKLLTPLWTNGEDGRLVTAMRLRGRIEKILDYARECGWRPEGPNPAVWKGRLENVLPDPTELRRLKPVEHHPRVPEAELYGFMVALREAQGSGPRCLEFVALTGARSGEAIGARWSEIDLERKAWTVPANRMKAGKEHMVPLSAQAVDLLKALPRFANNDRLFPSPRAHSDLSDATLSETMKRMIVKGVITQGVPHGLRRSLRTWAGESGYAREIAEAALAHTVGDNSVERAYLDTTYFERRKPLMQAWADFLDKPMPEEGSNVVSFRVAAE